MADASVIEGYAKGLLAIAEAEGALDRVEGELFAFAQAMESSNDLRDALTDPGLPASNKDAVIAELLGERANPVTTNIVTFVVNQGHAKDLPAIITGIASAAAERRNAALAEVRTAVALSTEQQAQITAALTAAVGRPVEIRTVVDPTIIGGVVARIGDEVIDGSVRSRLEEASLRLKGA